MKEVIWHASVVHAWCFKMWGLWVWCTELDKMSASFVHFDKKFCNVFDTLQVWFDRRTNYTRSLAVMSMVGYILGLGDR